MTDRATGSYTAERLIALEDSHNDMIQWIIRELAWLKHIRPQGHFPSHIGLGFDQAQKTGDALIAAAYKIRDEAGL